MPTSPSQPPIKITIKDVNNGMEIKLLDSLKFVKGYLKEIFFNKIKKKKGIFPSRFIKQNFTIGVVFLGLNILRE
jgi:hypothetical protein